MKRHFTYFFFLLLFLFTDYKSKAQYVTIPDAHFVSFLQFRYPSCMSGNMLDTTCTNIINEISMDVTGQGLTDLTGIQYFDGLQYLYCYSNQLTFLPPLPSGLLQLYCFENNLTSLPTLPSGLTVLFVSENPNLTSLPMLPASLDRLYCEACKLSSLPVLPSLLDKIWCGGNQITNIPSLPPALTFLSCPGNLLTSLPTLPSSLITLECGSSNSLTSLPTLPSSLESLTCAGNPLFTHLPSLPSSLITLNCNQCNLVEFPALPPALQTLNCYYNQLSDLPELPSSLVTLTCYFNNITCLPYLPASLETLLVGSTNITCLPNLPPSPTLNADITTVCTPSNTTNGCTIYPLLTGTVFADMNSNGVQDNGENGYANAKLELQPTGYILQADQSGFYSINIDTGLYDIGIYTPHYPHFTATPSSKNIHFTSYGDVSTANDFALQPTTIGNDVYTVITPLSSARAGREIGYMITSFNAGTTTLDGSIDFQYDNILNFVSVTPSQSGHTANNLTWNFTQLKPGEYQIIKVYFTVPTTTIAGTTINFTATVNPIAGDLTPDDNIYTLTQKVISSYDPNFKEVLPESDITTEQVSDQEHLIYTVHFQNTGTDTAFTVTIKDTISTNFEIQEIQTIASSHNYLFFMKNNAAVWTFNDINLPDSTTDERNSHGFVQYKIIPKNTLVPGDEIKNTAHIVFDYNIPVPTNTTLNRVAIPTENKSAVYDKLEVYPNPSKGLFVISTNSQGKGTMRIISAEGRVIQTDDNVLLSQPITVDLNHEPKGIYLIQLVSEEGQLTKKIILH